MLEEWLGRVRKLTPPALRVGYWWRAEGGAVAWSKLTFFVRILRAIAARRGGSRWLPRC